MALAATDLSLIERGRRDSSTPTAIVPITAEPPISVD
jgi:hypothetical protein